MDAKTANYTLVLNDAGKLITMSSTSARTITVPSDTVAFATGTIVYLSNLNTGVVTISPASGVTINAPAAIRTLTTQYRTAMLIKRASNTWLLVGADPSFNG